MEDGLLLGVKNGLDEGAEDGVRDDRRDGNEMACCLVSSSASTKGLKACSKMQCIGDSFLGIEQVLLFF
jgi:hypothetical protein